MPAFAQPFELAFQVSDGTFSRTVTVGMRADASDGFDQGLDEPAPPPFTNTVFFAHAYNANIPPSGTAFYTEYRSIRADSTIYQFEFQRSTGQSEITVTWDPASLPNGRTFTIVGLNDASQPVDVPTNSNFVTSVSRNAQLEDGFRLLVGAGTGLPVELAGFDGRQVEDHVRLEWATLSETGNAGFFIERKALDVASEQADGSEWIELGFVEGAGTTDEPQTYTFDDFGFSVAPTGVSYRLRQVDFDGAFEYSPVVEVALNAPTAFGLSPAFPNPFAGSTRIRYALAEASAVRLTLHDALGRLVYTVRTGTLQPGWHESDLDATALPAGLYLIRLETDTGVTTRRVVKV
ncbi:MAG: T9SS type A sorting domain-containing protein [Bacteroidota bacterium]